MTFPLFLGLPHLHESDALVVQRVAVALVLLQHDLELGETLGRPPRVHQAGPEVGPHIAEARLEGVLVQEMVTEGTETIVGVNKHRLETEDPLDILEVDNTAVRIAQFERLAALRANRDEAQFDSTATGPARSLLGWR